MSCNTTTIYIVGQKGQQDQACRVHRSNEWCTGCTWHFSSLVNRILCCPNTDPLVCLPQLQVSIDAMFDVQIKRIHEYKRQLLNILGIIHRYDCIKVLLINLLPCNYLLEKMSLPP